LGDWDKAIEAASKALQLKPDYTLARNNLAWSISQKSRRASK
jgi:Flp pilus assembly protein TadD